MKGASGILRGVLDDRSPRAAASRPAATVHRQAGGLCWRLPAGAVSQTLQAVMADPDRCLAASPHRLKEDQVVTIVRVPAAHAGEADLVLRRSNYGKIRHRLRDWLRTSRAHRALEIGRRLNAAAVPAPRTLAAADRRCLGWPLAAYLVMEAVPEPRTLAAFLLEDGGVPRAAVIDLADAVARLHDGGFSHRDLRWTNVLFDARLRASLIDLDGIRHFPRLEEERARADLARLARDFLAFPEVLRWSGARFLKRYCRRRGREAMFRPWARAIASILGLTLRA